MEKSAYKRLNIEVDEKTDYVKVHDLLMFIGKYKKKRGAEIMFNRLPPVVKNGMVPMNMSSRRGKRAFYANNETVCAIVRHVVPRIKQDYRWKRQMLILFKCMSEDMMIEIMPTT